MKEHMDVKDVRFILALILVVMTATMCMYEIVIGNIDGLKTVMSTFGVLASTVVTYYFTRKSEEKRSEEQKGR